MSSERIKTPSATLEKILSAGDKALFKAAWQVARKNHGDTFSFYLPGMIRYGRQRGRYPAISITGNQCDLLCEHCKGKLLEPLVKAGSPDVLLRIAGKFAQNGAHGILLTGGADRNGRLPWKRYYESIQKIRERSSLYLSAHTGFPDRETCRLLKNAGLNQALIDVIGDEKAASQIYHLPSLETVLRALEALNESGLELVPHVVAGLHYGKIEAEYEALKIIKRFQPAALVVVVLTPLKGTPMTGVSPPHPLEIGRLIATARLLMPEVPISLGCERSRNRDGWLMERLAIRAGANRMAVWSEAAIEECKHLGLAPRFQATCCSLDFRPDFGLIIPSLVTDLAPSYVPHHVCF
jgi:uncharacterized radical SAM superfamily protein